MADDATDTLFGFILFILFLALIGYAAGGLSSSPSTAGTTGGTSQSYPPLPGGQVASCDMGTRGPSTSNPTSPPNTTLTVYFFDGGRTCATALYTPDPDPNLPTSTGKDATLKVTLAYTGNTTIARSASTDIVLSPSDKSTQMVSVMVTGADNLCLSAFAELARKPPSTSLPAKVEIKEVNQPCDPTPAAPPPAGPMRDAPAIDVKEDQEDGF